MYKKRKQNKKRKLPLIPSNLHHRLHPLFHHLHLRRPRHLRSPRDHRRESFLELEQQFPVLLLPPLLPPLHQTILESVSVQAI